jgi:hypothetical protein
MLTSMRLRFLYLLLCVVVAVSTMVIFSAVVFAQTETATLSGVVTDPQGAVVPGVEVVATRIETGIILTIQTNGAGIYFFTGLMPGHYHLVVRKQGFKEIAIKEIELHVQDKLERNFSLDIGALSETITVTGEGVTMNTTDASVSTVVDRKFVENIPLNGRSFQDLISMTPGVVTQSPQSSTHVGNNGDFSVNGQRTESNYYMVDGVSANTSSGYATGYAQAANGGTIAATTALGTTQSLVSVDALQEFRVESSTYSAEYGHNPGGQFSFVTRSGTNDFHGVLFDYLRNNAFDANDWFNNRYRVSQPALRQNDFGGTLGGPIWIPHLYKGKDKTFFFVSYEGLRLTQPQAATIQYVPDSALRQSAPAALQPILNAFPKQSINGIDYPSAGLAQFIGSYSSPSHIDATSVRLDHTFSSHMAAFFRYSDTPGSVITRNLSTMYTIESNAQSYTLGITNQFGDAVTNEFRLGYANSQSILNATLDTFGGASPTDIIRAMGLGGYSNPYGLFYLSIPLNGQSVGTTYIGAENAQNLGHQWNLVDGVSLLLGRHQVKVGVDYRRIISPLLPASPYALAYFASSGSIVTNSPLLVDVFKYTNATPIFNEFALYAQDTWRISPKVTLSAGLRWEVDPPPTEAHGNDAYTLKGDIANPSSLTLAPRGTPLWKTTWFNFAPRLGASWLVHGTPGMETVLRAGGGVFFDTANELATQGYNGLGSAAVKAYFGAPLPLTSAQLDFSPSATAPYTSGTIYAFPSHLQLPYALQWSVGVEQALGKPQVLTLSYVGSAGRRLIQEQQYSLKAFNPNFGTVIIIPSGVTSDYQALQVSFQRSVAKGLQALASYTWSHSIDFGSNNSALPLIRGNSDFDVRHQFQAGFSWDLPRVSPGSLRGVVLDHWGLDIRAIARTGFPITLQGKSLTNSATGSTYSSGVNVIPGQPIYLYGSQFPGGLALNPAAFAVPSGNSSGNAPRNFVRGFGEFQLNLAARREFHLRQGVSLEFRAEAFNVLNHPNFGYIDPTLTSATFGQATQLLNHSLGTMASQYQQGGPRSMQFALKIRF